jgi:hypothetical protein
MKPSGKKNRIKIIKMDNSFTHLYNNRYFKCLIGCFYGYITGEEDTDKIICAMEDKDIYNKWIIRYMDYCRGDVLESEVAVSHPHSGNDS